MSGLFCIAMSGDGGGVSRPLSGLSIASPLQVHYVSITRQSPIHCPSIICQPAAHGIQIGRRVNSAGRVINLGNCNHHSGFQRAQLFQPLRLLSGDGGRATNAASAARRQP